MLLYEKYRPRTYADVIGQGKAIATLDTIRRTEGLAGQAIWLAGKSGMGKTTLARLIAAEVTGETTVEEIDAQDVTLEVIRQWEDRARFRPMFGQGYCVVINECHRLPQRIVSRLLTFCELPRVQEHFTLIGTTTLEGDTLFDESFDALPFGSRTKEIRLTSQGVAKPAAEYLKHLAESENLDGQPVEKYLRLFNDCHGNFRAAIQKIASGIMVK